MLFACAPAAGATGTLFGRVEAIMTQILTKLGIGMVAAILLAAISTSTIGGAVAQARLGHIARDGLTNRYEPPQSETDFQLPLNM